MAEKNRKSRVLGELKTEAARQARRNFDRRFEELLGRERRIALSILVWGMSPDKDVPIARKRQDIGNQLIEDGHNAMFSEDLVNVDRGMNISDASRELAQARAADFIIVLIEGSPGALAEVCDLCVRPDIAHKVCIMAPQVYRTGYAGKGDLRDLDEGYGAVHWYRPQDVVACDLLTEACKRVQARRSIAYRDQSGRAS